MSTQHSSKVRLDPKRLFGHPDFSVLYAPNIECQVYERKPRQTPKRITQIASTFANSNTE